MVKNTEKWFVYIILCSDQSLYTGISKDVNKRFEQHLNKKGAKYFYARAPVKVVYKESFKNHGEALSREYAIKKLSSKQKKLMIKGNVSLTN
ncbi:MAG TPA: GIY-YIG nuclease family protein [Oligoflexia bacterium]|nr:GIY-YIG nuclease family protein [Oligoflexia bacterium]HMR24623.1 GIY-YIG nuclease family protein [Oligoflexia bacterium]